MLRPRGDMGHEEEEEEENHSGSHAPQLRPYYGLVFGGLLQVSALLATWSGPPPVSGSSFRQARAGRFRQGTGLLATRYWRGPTCPHPLAWHCMGMVCLA